MVASTATRHSAQMKIAYYINQHSNPSATFIRREIKALEEDGVVVERFSARRPEVEIKDPADREECSQTRYLNEAGGLRLLKALAVETVRQPGATARAFAKAMKLGGLNNRGRLVHFIYLCQGALLKQWLIEAEVSHVHGHYGTNTACVLLLSKIFGGPTYSFTVHGPEEFDSPRELALADKIDLSAFTVAISHYGRSQLFRWIEYANWAKIKIVHCGVDAGFLGKTPDEVPDSNRMVCIGRISEQKGHGILIEAAQILKERGRSFEFRLLGDGPLKGAIEAEIKTHNLQDCVTLVGWATSAEVRDELLAARALALPSFAEGLPVVIMEALALGRPVVTTAIAGIPELVTPGETGWLVPAGSAPAFADAVEALLDTPVATLSQMGAEGSRRVNAEHNAVTEAARLRALIEDATER